MSAVRTIRFSVTPVRKPRQTRSDKWKQRPTVMRYRAFADELRAAAAKVDFVVPMSGAVVTFWMPMPKSWSAKMRATMNGKPHQQVPDVDNLAKAFLDALCGNDCSIWNITVEKRWAEYGRIDVRVPPLTEIPSNDPD